MLLLSMINNHIRNARFIIVSLHENIQDMHIHCTTCANKRYTHVHINALLYINIHIKMPIAFNTSHMKRYCLEFINDLENIFLRMNV